MQALVLPKHIVEWKEIPTKRLNSKSLLKNILKLQKMKKYIWLLRHED